MSSRRRSSSSASEASFAENADHESDAEVEEENEPQVPIRRSGRQSAPSARKKATGKPTNLNRHT